MKMVERIFKHKIRQQIDIHDMQFSFMRRERITDAIFVVRRMQKKEGRKKCTCIYRLYVQISYIYPYIWAGTHYPYMRPVYMGSVYRALVL